MRFKRYIQKSTLSHVILMMTVTNLVNHEMVKNRKTCISRERNVTFLGM